MKQLLSGNEALALGAHLAGVRVATAYPGTPSSEILESLIRFKEIYTEWSTNEKVAMEVALGAAYGGARTLVAMKHVGLNVAMDPFMAAAITGINAGMVVVSADDPGMHSSQNEQDNRYLAKFAKVPMFEPADSQEACDLIKYAFDVSEEFDTPVMVRSTTRISHSKSVVDVQEEQVEPVKARGFQYNVPKYVMLPVHARARRPGVEARLVKLEAYSESFPLNRIFPGKPDIGIVASGIAYQYAREVFPEASFLKLSMTYPLPRNLILDFASKVKKLIVIEELEPFLQEALQSMGLKVSGKEFIPRIGELNTRIIEEAGRSAGLIATPAPKQIQKPQALPDRPPLLCPGCPHASMFFVLSSLGKRSIVPKSGNRKREESDLIITGDIGCYSLGANSPFFAMDTGACMGASIGQALGLEKAGVNKKIMAVIGDSTFMHSGITGLVNAVYNNSHITVIILDNGTTAMTGHQGHPGTGISARGEETHKVEIASLVRGIGVKDVREVDAFDVRAIRQNIRAAIDSFELSVIISHGPCAMLLRTRSETRAIDALKCNQCSVCSLVGCSAIRLENGQFFIDAALCVGDSCNVCLQICPQKAIAAKSDIPVENVK